MERVAFLIESTGQRLGCLLNPESLVLQRQAGVQSRQGVSGTLTGHQRSDDPVHIAGGGVTELTLDLLFDVSIAGSSAVTGDVRELTGPLWDLAETAGAPGVRYDRVPKVRFVWGKSWNIPGLVTAVAERLDAFSATGVPKRSWLRMRLRRIADSDVPRGGMATKSPPEQLQQAEAIDSRHVTSVRVQGAPASEQRGAVNGRLDQLAAEHLGDPGLWRLIAAFNRIADPLRIPAGMLLKIPDRNAHR